MLGLVRNGIWLGAQFFQLGNDAALEGTVRIFAHYGGHGDLVVEPVVIGDSSTIGLAATVMGDVQVDADAMILAHSVLMPGSRVGKGGTWGGLPGLPARPISRKEIEHFNKEIGIRPTR